MIKIKTGDYVRVISGDDKGKAGSVMKVIKIKSNLRYKQIRYKIVVSGVNVKSYTKKSQTGIRRESKEFPVDISNVALVDKNTDTTSRVGFRFDENSIKRRYFKKTGGLI